tara:strand:- start:44 stop:763 length:720 start_codon:yes stop_codon:yes gene_type:complete
MKLLRNLLLHFFDLIDEFYHQKRIEKFIKKNKIKIKTFIDVGAFEGKYTDLILKIQEKCKVIMIEPQSKYYSLLKEKYKNNNLIKIMKIGISDKETLLKLKINKHEITSTFSQFNDTNKYLNYKAILFNSNLKNMTTNSENIEVFPLSLILQKNNLDSIDLIKIDTEGHEYEVLYGMGDYIKKINYILVEFHIDKIYENYNSDKIHNFLLENGFTLQKKFSFPFTTWEDRLYKNSKFLN